MEVHREPGNGFQEVIYHRALAHEFDLRHIPFKREYEMPVFYKDKQVGKRRADFLVENVVSVELKAIIQLEPVHLAQAINCLEAYKSLFGIFG